MTATTETTTITEFEHWLETVRADRLAPVAHIAQFFAYDHLPEALQQISVRFWAVAVVLIASIKDNPELTVALRNLLIAKDAAVRAVLIGEEL